MKNLPNSVSLYALFTVGGKRCDLEAINYFDNIRDLILLTSSC